MSLIDARQVHIAHNVQIGKGVLIAAQTGIAGCLLPCCSHFPQGADRLPVGSCSISDRVLIGGQVGIAQHLKVGARAKVAEVGKWEVDPSCRLPQEVQSSMTWTKDRL
eukprot:754449-Hanusia_phi.AAC.3